MPVVIGAFEAKTHLSALLERAAAGEEIVITKHGRPMARLVPAQQLGGERASRAVEKLKALRQETSLAGLSWKMLRDEGRP